MNLASMLLFESLDEYRIDDIELDELDRDNIN